MTRTISAVTLLVAIVSLSAGVRAWQRPYFYPDDPIATYPEPADASKVRPRSASQGFDFVENAFLKPGERVQRKAGNVNTVDEVPDSSWFTNRIGTRPMTLDEIRRGPDQSTGPAGAKWKVLLGEATGTTPGFRVRDGEGQLYFIKFDQPKNAEMVSGAEVISTKIFHALGYYVPENYVVTFTRDMLDISDAQITLAEGRRRAMAPRDLDNLLSKAARNSDGSYRVVASRAIAGTILGPFRYYATVPDDPNDVVPHEHRRELRGMRVFAAWLNHMDSRGINSLDTLIDDDAGKRVRHYLLDFGSTLGSASNTVKSRRSGNSYLWDFGDSMRTMATFGLYVPRWAFVDFPDHIPAVGRFESKYFRPEAWVPHYENPAFENARPDDTFWAARRVLAFSNEAIRAAVEAARYSDARATDYITQVLIERRDKIGRTWLTAVNPLVNFQLDASGAMHFENAAVAANVADPPREYRIQWSTFDNSTGTATAVGSEAAVASTNATAPAGLLQGKGAEFVQARIVSVHDRYPAWKKPIRVTFRREGTGWKTVGVEGRE
jgi:hypothetical protein